MAANPHKVVVLQSWGGQKLVRVYWCPVRMTYLFEADGHVKQMRNGKMIEGCIECGKKVKYDT